MKLRFSSLLLLYFLLSVGACGTARAAQVAGASGPPDDQGKTVIYRDEYGVPHIYADTVEQGIYAIAHAQAEDRLEELLKNYLTDKGMATLRSIHFGQPRADHTRWGGGGQTSTQIIVLTKPIRSWTQPPIGQSDRPDSPFYRDQAQKLFSPAKMKPTWYAKEELLKHVSSRTELKPNL